jgi:hypothetical protein
MPTALSDPSTTFYVILLIVVFGLAAFWLRKKSRGNLIRLLLGVGVLAAVFLIDRFFESPREEATRKLHEMAQASQDNNWNPFFNNVSDSFKYKSPSGAEFDKQTFRDWATTIAAIPGFKGVIVWDFHRADFRPIDNDNFKIGFRAKPKDVPNLESEVWIVATFHRDPDGQWRMSGFNCYDRNKQDRNDNPPMDIQSFRSFN